MCVCVCTYIADERDESIFIVNNTIADSCGNSVVTLKRCGGAYIRDDDLEIPRARFLLAKSLSIP